MSGQDRCNPQAAVNFRNPPDSASGKDRLLVGSSPTAQSAAGLSSQISLLRHDESVVYFNPEVANGALNFGVA